MLSNKIFVCDGAGFLESDYLNLEKSDSYNESTIFVNPKISSLIWKKIIINFPYDINIKKLSEFNHFVFRFPINNVDNSSTEYEIIPYEFTTEEVLDYSDISPLILNKYILSNIDKIPEIKGKKFLLGTEFETNNNLNIIGYSLFKYNYNNLK